jgi:hypothetical protein
MASGLPKKHEESGFIVHPNWTGNSKYHASYGTNKNRTNRSFNSLKEAKTFLAKKGVRKGIYERSTGEVTGMKTEQRKTTQHKRRYSRGFGGFSGSLPKIRFGF